MHLIVRFCVVDCVITESITHTGKVPTSGAGHTAHNEHLCKKKNLVYLYMRFVTYIVYVIMRCLLYDTPFTTRHRKGTTQGSCNVGIYFKNFDYNLSLIYKVIMTYVGKAGRIQQWYVGLTLKNKVILLRLLFFVCWKSVQCVTYIRKGTSAVYDALLCNVLWCRYV